MDIKNGRFYLGDCLEVMKEIPDGVVDMILCDPPYGTTACSWDSVIPFDKLWEQYNRICKENAAMVFTASQPFTTALIASNIDNFKYELVWFKHQATNPTFAKKGILKVHENVCVFYKKLPTYNPQFEYGKAYKGFKSRIGKKIGEVYSSINSEHKGSEDGKLYPTSALYFPGNSGRGGDKNSFHPTQKPVELFEYLIRTYTNEGDLVLDNTAGSGTTAIAAENTRRKWVCIERNEEYATKAVERIWNHEATPQQASEVKIDSNIPVPEGDEQCK